MISRVKEAILEGGGYLLDFHLFSNTAICLNFEVSVGNIEKLAHLLTATNLRLNQESHELLAGCCHQSGEIEESVKATDVVGTLNITFIHSEPDLRREVPPIPG